MDPSISARTHPTPAVGDGDPADAPQPQPTWQESDDLDADLAADGDVLPTSRRCDPPLVGRASRDAADEGRQPFFDRPARRLASVLVVGALTALGVVIALVHRSLGF